jgi:hypothetical protein
VARQPGLHHELVLIDQPQFRQRQRKLHASKLRPGKYVVRAVGANAKGAGATVKAAFTIVKR